MPAPENFQALALIDAWPNWPAPTLLLQGPAGSGKSHLGAIWARSSGALTLTGNGLAQFSPNDVGARSVLVDDADQVGASEASLFHLINLARENGSSLLLTARQPPDMWGLETPDLRSRLRLAPMTVLAPPEASLVQAVLFKLFSDRQLVVERSVIDYIALRLERSLDATRAIVAALDKEALARGKRVTRSMAAEYFRDTSAL